jgi:hypothetical protein
MAPKAEQPGEVQPTLRRLALALVAGSLAGLVLVLAVLLGPPPAAAGAVQEDGPNSDFGRISPVPNSGAEPEDPGDRGGWQQLALFVLVCGVILAMGAWVWWRSRIRRDRRRAAGGDPVEVAKREGGDVRAPRPPGIVD